MENNPDQVADQQQQSTEKKVFEQKKNEWFTQDETDEVMGIETFVYDNGSILKKCKLSDGRTAECRRLKGKDNVLIQRLTGGDGKKTQSAISALCTKIDGKEIVFEDLNELWYNDFTTINIMASSINFM